MVIAVWPSAGVVTENKRPKLRRLGWLQELSLKTMAAYVASPSRIKVAATNAPGCQSMSESPEATFSKAQG